MSRAGSDAWSDFWVRNCDTGSGCLPAKWAGIDAAQQAAWRRLAARFPRRARVLDLATGDGRVMRWLLAARRDLRLVGIDLAPVLPDPPRGTKVHTGISMEKLPFPDGAFDAVTSQFGLEYGETGAVANEIARVARTGALVGLLMHRGDGPILAHNLKRRDAIQWAIETRDLVGIARRSLALRTVGVAVVPPLLAAAPSEGARMFGRDSAAWEIAEAVNRILSLGAGDHPSNVAMLLESVLAQATNECGRIASLASACACADDDATLAHCFARAGLSELENAGIAESGSSQPFARFRVLQRS